MNFQVDFSTREYVRAHGKEPRGRGQWAFCPAALYNRDNYLDYVMWSTAGTTYAAAKQQARAYFAAKGVSEVVVCS